MTNVDPRPDSGEHPAESVARILRESPSAPDFTVAERLGAARILDGIAAGWPIGPARQAVAQVAQDLRDPGKSLPFIVARLAQLYAGPAEHDLDEAVRVALANLRAQDGGAA